MNPLPDTKRHDAVGFTLVEVLVALAIVALISVLATQSLSFSIRSWRDGDTRANAVQRSIAAYDLVHDQLLVALPYYGSPNDPDRASSFRGDANGFRVATRGPLALGLSGITWFNVASERAAGGTAMAVSWSEDEEGTAPLSTNSGQTKTVILDRLEKLEFSYFGQITSAARPGWTTSWPRRDRPPDLVRIIADFRDEARGDWPDLIVHIRTDMSSRCHFDPVSRICRLY